MNQNRGLGLSISNMNISLTIMAHPRRSKEANELYRRLQGYPFFKISIIWDEQNNEWKTGQRALRDHIKVEDGHAQASDWHVVLQDDAIIPTNFYNHIVAAITHVPERTLISLYTGTVRPLRRRVLKAVQSSKGVSWLRSSLLYWGVGIVIPTQQIEPMLDFVSDREEPYDFRIGLFYRGNALPVYYTNPSLVDHNDDLPSIVGNGRTKNPDEDARVAHNFVDDSSPVWNSRFLDI